MTARDEKHLRHLLDLFGVHDLGDGDPVAGANTLAAMACVLANLAPDDGTLRFPDGSAVRLGVSLLAGGASTAGLVADEVVSEVARRQNNATVHLRRYLEAMEKRARTPGEGPMPAGPGSFAGVDLLAGLMGSLDFPGPGRERDWSRLLDAAPRERVEHLIARPVFLVAAARPEDLEKALAGVRPGRPLVHLGLDQPSDLAALGGPAAALLDGRLRTGGGGETARGNLLVVDPLGIADGAGGDAGGPTAWLGRLVRLSDGGAGPDLPAGAGGKHPGRAGEVRAGFQSALGRVLARRMDNLDTYPESVGWSPGGARFRWSAFLREMEPRLPGIAFAARNLLVSLLFGLAEIARDSVPERIAIPGAEAFARHLVHRMANARAAMLDADGAARRRSRIGRVFRKLEDGPRDPRSLYRDLSLAATDCVDCLEWLEANNLIRRDGRDWVRVEGAALRFDASEAPVLEAACTAAP